MPVLGGSCHAHPGQNRDLEGLTLPPGSIGNHDYRGSCWFSSALVNYLCKSPPPMFVEATFIKLSGSWQNNQKDRKWKVACWGEGFTERGEDEGGNGTGL